MTDRSDEMARFLMRTAGEIHRSGKLNRATFADDLNAALRARWPDVQLREIEAAALKFVTLADRMAGLARPANDRMPR